MDVERIALNDKGIIFSPDVSDFVVLRRMTKAMQYVKGISGCKLGFSLGLKGLGAAVQIVREIMGNDFPVIYDHQKGGTDTPDTARLFAEALMYSGVRAAILYPFSGPATQEAWTRVCRDHGIQVMIGGMMTHPQFLESEGGYISDYAPERIYRLGCQLGVNHFVVPGNKTEWVKQIRAWLVEELGEDNFVLYAPGFFGQGGDIVKCGRFAGERWHPIVGGYIYKKPTMEAMRQSAMVAVAQLYAPRD